MRGSKRFHCEPIVLFDIHDPIRSYVDFALVKFSSLRPILGAESLPTLTARDILSLFAVALIYHTSNPLF